MSPTLAEVSPLVREILDGDHDSELDYIQQACAARMKRKFRKHGKVEIIAGQNIGRTGEILKVNAKRISVGVGEKTVEGAGTAWAHDVYEFGQWNIPPTMLKVIG